jgi:hypothetical protein
VKQSQNVSFRKGFPGLSPGHNGARFNDARSRATTRLAVEQALVKGSSPETTVSKDRHFIVVYKKGLAVTS